jgi:hypothetical protein
MYSYFKVKEADMVTQVLLNLPEIHSDNFEDSVLI